LRFASRRRDRHVQHDAERLYGWPLDALVTRGRLSERVCELVGPMWSVPAWPRAPRRDEFRYLVGGGIAWRALPADFPPHQTVYALFRRWTNARAWCRSYPALRERARLADGRGQCRPRP
jgi:hypothetical protein